MRPLSSKASFLSSIGPSSTTTNIYLNTPACLPFLSLSTFPSISSLLFSSGPTSSSSPTSFPAPHATSSTFSFSVSYIAPGYIYAIRRMGSGLTLSSGYYPLHTGWHSFSCARYCAPACMKLVSVVKGSLKVRV